MRTWIVLALVGCGSAARPLPSHQVAAPTACLGRDFRDAAIERLVAHGDRATLCYQRVEERDGAIFASGNQPGDRACFALDTRGAILGEVPYVESAVAPERPAAYTIAWTTGATYKVCDARGRCVAVTARHAPNDRSLAGSAVVSDDGARAFVMNARTGKAGTEIWGELLDVAGARSLSDFRLTEDNAFTDTGITRAVDLYGEKVAVGIFHAGPCCGTWLFDGRDGTRIPLHDWAGQRFRIDAATLLAFDGHTASVIDLPTMQPRVVLTFGGTPYEDSPELRSSAIVQTPTGALIAHARPAGIVLFDAKTQALAGAREIPLCGGRLSKE